MTADGSELLLKLAHSLHQVFKRGCRSRWSILTRLILERQNILLLFIEASFHAIQAGLALFIKVTLQAILATLIWLILVFECQAVLLLLLKVPLYTLQARLSLKFVSFHTIQAGLGLRLQGPCPLI